MKGPNLTYNLTREKRNSMFGTIDVNELRFVKGSENLERISKYRNT